MKAETTQRGAGSGDLALLGAERSWNVIALSGDSRTALRVSAGELVAHVDAHSEQTPADIARATNARRGLPSHGPHRAAVIASNRRDLIEALTAVAGGGDHRLVTFGPQGGAERPPRVAFLFTGSGAQYPGMGRELYATQRVFREAIDRCATVLDRLLPKRLASVLFPLDGEVSPIYEMRYTQPALFAFEYALAQLWMAWGIRPDVVVGHSTGEITAACIAGVLVLEDALVLVAERGRLLGELPPGGAMISVDASEERVAQAIAEDGGQVAIASVNGPDQVVISGTAEATHRVAERLRDRGVEVSELWVPLAAHSALVEPMMAAFSVAISGLRYARPRISLISNVTGRLADDRVGTPAYWVEHVRAPVRFASGMATLAAQGADVLVEIGPHPVLLGMGRSCLPEGRRLWLPSHQRDRDAWSVLLRALAGVYAHGGPVDWEAVDRLDERSVAPEVGTEDVPIMPSGSSGDSAASR